MNDQVDIVSNQNKNDLKIIYLITKKKSLH